MKGFLAALTYNMVNSFPKTKATCQVCKRAFEFDYELGHFKDQKFTNSYMKKIRFNKAPCVYNQGTASANSKFYGGSLLPANQ